MTSQQNPNKTKNGEGGDKLSQTGSGTAPSQTGSGDGYFVQSAKYPSPSHPQTDTPGTDRFASAALRQKSSSPDNRPKDGDELFAQSANNPSPSRPRPQAPTTDAIQYDGTELTERNLAARARLREQSLRYLQAARANNSTFTPNLTTLGLEDVAQTQAGMHTRKGTSDTPPCRPQQPPVVHNPANAPAGPPWNYEPTQDEIARKQERREARAARKDKVKAAAQKKTPDKLKHPSDLQVRFRTAVVYTLVTIICIMASDATTLAYLMVVAGICAGEFYYMLRHDAKLPNEALGCAGAVLYPLAFYVWGFAGAILVTVALLLALLVWYVFWLRARVADVGISFFGAVYTGFLLCGLLLIRQSLDGWQAGAALMLVFLSVWANDAFAYFAGSKFGRHKLAPRISPKKSWEGFIAGLFGSALCWVVLSFLPGIDMPVWMAVVFGVICGLFEVLGDLAESRIKRNSGFKDSGTIMPGHGGLLDRCDSLFLASITSAALLLFGGCINFAIF